MFLLSLNAWLTPFGDSCYEPQIQSKHHVGALISPADQGTPSPCFHSSRSNGCRPLWDPLDTPSQPLVVLRGGTRSKRYPSPSLG